MLLPPRCASPGLQAGGRRFEPGWLHWRTLQSGWFRGLAPCGAETPCRISRGQTEEGIVPEPRELLTAYRERLSGLRRGAGPAGALFSPLELSADLLEQLLGRQQALETQLNTALQPLKAAYGLTRDAPALLRTQARAFEAASTSFDQAAQIMNRQADLLERTLAGLDVPAGLLRSARSSGNEGPPPP